MLRLRQLITSDEIALEKWPVIVDHIVPKASDKFRIKNLYKDHEYEAAVLESLKLCQADGGKISDLIKVLKEHKLNALAARILSKEIVLDEPVVLDLRQLAPKAPAKVWFEVGDVVYNFTGREKELGDLHEILTKSHSTKSVASNIVSICGLGGIGKSSLAREYAHRHRGDYDGNVIWINAETVGSMRASFVRLADRLGYKHSEQEATPGITKWVYENLADRKSLFIFDNVEEKSDFIKFVPKCENPDKETPYILVTTRRNDVVPVPKNQLSLDVLTIEEAVQLILEQVPYASRESANELAETLQRLPLTLQQALAYIRDKYTSDGECIAKYLQEYQISSQALLNDERFKDDTSEYSATTFSTWNITLNRIKEMDGGQGAIETITLLAYLNSDSITTRFVKRVLQQAPKIGMGVESSLKLLERFSMITVSNGRIGIHRLVQQVVRLTSSQEQETEILNLIVNAIDRQLGKLKFTDSSREYVSHAVHVFPVHLRHAGLFGKTSEYLSVLCYYLEYFGNYWDAVSIAERSASHYFARVGEMHEDTLKMKWRVAEGYYKTGVYSDALQILESISPISESVLGAEHRLTMLINTSLAATYTEVGNPTKAIAMYNEIIPIRIRRYGENHAHVLHTKQAKADAWYKLNKYDEALGLYDYVHEKRKQFLRKNDLLTLMTRRNIGNVFHAKGEMRKAVAIWMEVHESLVQAVGETHPETIKIRRTIENVKTSICRESQSRCKVM